MVAPPSLRFGAMRETDSGFRSSAVSRMRDMADKPAFVGLPPTLKLWRDKSARQVGAPNLVRGNGMSDWQ